MKVYEKPFFKVSVAPFISYHLFIKEVTHEIRIFQKQSKTKGLRRKSEKSALSGSTGQQQKSCHF